MSSFVLSKLGSNHVEEISEANNDPTWLREYRKNAFAIFQQLPQEVSPLYNKYSDANKMDSEQITFSLSSDSTVPDFVKDRLSEIGENASIVQIGTNIHKIHIPSELKETSILHSTMRFSILEFLSIFQKILS
jgi:Fe-S cluster assembly protein SufB/Fe-S cluster assembly protein SufD